MAVRCRAHLKVSACCVHNARYSTPYAGATEAAHSKRNWKFVPACELVASDARRGLLRVLSLDVSRRSPFLHEDTNGSTLALATRRQEHRPITKVHIGKRRDNHGGAFRRLRGARGHERSSTRMVTSEGDTVMKPLRGSGTCAGSGQEVALRGARSPLSARTARVYTCAAAWPASVSC